MRRSGVILWKLNVLRLVAASLFTIFISTCTMINFKLIVSKNEINTNKYKNLIVLIVLRTLQDILKHKKLIKNDSCAGRNNYHRGPQI